MVIFVTSEKKKKHNFKQQFSISFLLTPNYWMLLYINFKNKKIHVVNYAN